MCIRDSVFVSSDGQPLRRSGFRRSVFQPAVKRAGLDGLTFHGLRHSAATQWQAQGVDIVTAKNRLGHADSRMILELYAHPDKDADKAAADLSAVGFWGVDENLPRDFRGIDLTDESPDSSEIR